MGIFFCPLYMLVNFLCRENSLTLSDFLFRIGSENPMSLLDEITYVTLPMDGQCSQLMPRVSGDGSDPVFSTCIVTGHPLYYLELQTLTIYYLCGVLLVIYYLFSFPILWCSKERKL